MKRFWSMPQWNFWFFISFVVFGAAVYRPSSSGVDYTERRKTERKKFLYVFTITSPAALQHREKKFCVRKKNFYFSYYATMNEWEDNISFCSFWSCGLRETSRVDYTDFEEARLREKKGKCFPITSPGHHREKKY